MKRNKMSLANITQRLSRSEMKNILAGERDADAATGCTFAERPIPGWPICFDDCTFKDGRDGTCVANSGNTKCYCVAAF